MTKQYRTTMPASANGLSCFPDPDGNPRAQLVESSETGLTTRTEIIERRNGITEINGSANYVDEGGTPHYLEGTTVQSPDGDVFTSNKSGSIEKNTSQGAVAVTDANKIKKACNSIGSETSVRKFHIFEPN